MSVATEADKKISEAKQKIYGAVGLLDSAYDAIRDTLDPDTWGHSDLGSDYIDKLREFNLQLSEITNKLGIINQKL